MFVLWGGSSSGCLVWKIIILPIWAYTCEGAFSAVLWGLTNYQVILCHFVQHFLISSEFCGSGDTAKIGSTVPGRTMCHPHHCAMLCFALVSMEGEPP